MSPVIIIASAHLTQIMMTDIQTLKTLLKILPWNFMWPENSTLHCMEIMADWHILVHHITHPSIAAEGMNCLYRRWSYGRLSVSDIYFNTPCMQCRHYLMLKSIYIKKTSGCYMKYKSSTKINGTMFCMLVTKTWIGFSISIYSSLKL